MRLLVLGGTTFVGRGIVAAALEAGHAVTTFTRGQSDPGAFAGRVEQLHGDRDPDVGDGLAALTTGEWDACLDVSGYVPRIVGASARLLAERVGRYLFVSTGSVYEHPLPVGADEMAPRLPAADDGVEDVDVRYGELKVACEDVVREVYGMDRSTIIRPGIVAGAHDPTDRTTWWVRVAARSSVMVVPDDPHAWAQVVDARDLGAFSVHGVEAGLAGPYNVVGTDVHLADLALLAHQVTGSSAAVVRASAESLVAAGVAPFTDLPMWLPAADATFKRRSHARAARDGLVLRPLSQTLRDIAAWDASRDGGLATGLAIDALPGIAERLR